MKQESIKSIQTLLSVYQLHTIRKGGVKEIELGDNWIGDRERVKWACSQFGKRHGCKFTTKLVTSHFPYRVKIKRVL